jgi:hypothetical protein
MSDEQDWPFDQPPDAAAITLRAVLDGAPILLVSHDADDDGWQFLDGSEVDWRPSCFRSSRPPISDGRWSSIATSWAGPSATSSPVRTGRWCTRG